MYCLLLLPLHVSSLANCFAAVSSIGKVCVVKGSVAGESIKVTYWVEFVTMLVW